MKTPQRGVRKIAFALGVAVALGVFIHPSFGQPKDPQLGTWKFNQAQSHSDAPGARPQKVPAILKIEAVPGGHHFVSDFVNADGQTVHTIRPIDEFTYEYTYTAANGQKSSQHTVISRDGKTRTNTITGTTVKGQKYTTVAVYDKQ